MDSKIENETGYRIAVTPPHGPDAVSLLRAYLAELIARYFDRPTDDAEIDRYLADGHDSEDLAPPTGVLLLAARPGAAADGCVGLRRLDEETYELTRMFVRPQARGAGLASRLVTEAERAAAGLGAPKIRLNTRHDLVEARALYARHGYVEIPAYGDDPFADHWFEKRLG